MWHAWGDEKCLYLILVGNPEGKRHSEVLRVDERKILILILGKYEVQELD
jgi:hypothetical protein